MGKIAFPTRAEWIFSLKTFIASMGALYIGLAAGLPRPYWAMATVYIVANPLSGLTRSKAVFRAVGTLAGAAAAVFITPPLANSPILFVLAVSVWTGILTFLAFFDRTPRTYALMLAGYTVPLIAYPSIYSPTGVFDTGVARAEEILLGITCAAVVNSIFLPVETAVTVGQTTGKLLADIRLWIVSIIEADSPKDTAKQSRRLASDVVALDNLATHVRFDAAAANLTRHMKDFRERVARLPIVLDGFAGTLAVLQRDKALDADFAGLLADLKAWVAADQRELSDKETVRLSAAIREKHGRLVAAIADRRDWNGLLLKNALADVASLVDIWQDCNLLQSEIEAGSLARQRVELVSTEAVESQWHHDVGALAITAVSISLAGFVAGVIWLYSGWQAGVGFAMMALIAGPFFGAMDNPIPPLKAMALFMAVSNILAGIFEFGILPGVSSFAGLVAVFAIPFILFGTIMSRPQFALPGMLMTVGTASTVAVSSTYSADFVSFVEGGVASVIGVLFAVVWNGLTHSLGAALKARRIARLGWREIAAIARGRLTASPIQFSGRGLDRLAQFVPRQPAVVGTDLESFDMVAELRTGAALAQLRGQLRHLTPEQSRLLEGILQAVGSWFESKISTGNGNAPDPSILSDIDMALGTFDSAPNRAALTPALAELRQCLFPLAPAPHLDPDPAVQRADLPAIAAE